MIGGFIGRGIGLTSGGAYFLDAAYLQATDVIYSPVMGLEVHAAFLVKTDIIHEVTELSSLLQAAFLGLQDIIFPEVFIPTTFVPTGGLLFSGTGDENAEVDAFAPSGGIRFGGTTWSAGGGGASPWFDAP